MTEQQPANTCVRCKFAKPVNINVFQCMRFPPQIVFVGNPNGPAILFPQMTASGWCGEYQTKLELSQ